MNYRSTAIVTGASSGIGLSLIKRLAARGYRTVGVARDGQQLQKISNSLGEGHSYLALDLTRGNDLATICNYLRQHRVNLLVNNAGIGVYGKFTDNDCHQLLALNIEALVRLSAVFLQKAQRGDALLNVASALAFAPTPFATVYAASKSFVNSFTEALWYEYQNDGIYVASLCPAATVSNFHQRAGRNRGSRGMQSADEVARRAMQALDNRRQPLILTSATGQLMFYLAKVMPRKQLSKMMGSMMRRWIG